MSAGGCSRRLRPPRPPKGGTSGGVCAPALRPPCASRGISAPPLPTCATRGASATNSSTGPTPAPGHAHPPIPAQGAQQRSKISFFYPALPKQAAATSPAADGEAAGVGDPCHPPDARGSLPGSRSVSGSAMAVADASVPVEQAVGRGATAAVPEAPPHWHGRKRAAVAAAGAAEQGAAARGRKRAAVAAAAGPATERPVVVVAVAAAGQHSAVSAGEGRRPRWGSRHTGPAAPSHAQASSTRSPPGKEYAYLL